MICNPKPILCFLTDNEQTLDLCLRYWSLENNGTWSEKVTALQQASGWAQRDLLALIGASCRSYIKGIKCHDCGTVPEITSRQQFVDAARSFVRKGHVHRCRKCAQVAEHKRAAEAVAEEERTKVQVANVLTTLGANLEPVDYSALGYTEAFLLYSVLRAAGECWQGRQIMSLGTQAGKLAPTDELASAIYMQLYEEGIIAPTSSWSTKAFIVVDDASGTLRFPPQEVNWTLALPKDGTPIENVLGTLEGLLEQRDIVTVAGLWSMVSEAECERYFGELCERYRFSKEAVFTPKVAESIRYCLDRVSLAQVWNVLWCTMREIAALIQEGRYIRPHVYNMIASNIRRDIDRRLANNFPIRPWTRLRAEKEPIITGILFDKVLGKGDLAFETVSARNIRTFLL